MAQPAHLRLLVYATALALCTCGFCCYFGYQTVRLGASAVDYAGFLVLGLLGAGMPDGVLPPLGF